MNLRSLRVGEGWDTHALVSGRPLVLGGVTIAHSHGLLGHSDADEAWRGADSGRLLAEAVRRVRDLGYAPVNVDATIVAQAPKMAPHIPAMRVRIAGLLGLPPEDVNVKAKTAENMGPVGEGRAIEARAVCLLLRLEPDRP